MLIIGHRGAAGLAPENTLEALRAGMKAGADILEFDVRVTKDRIPILSHDFHTWRTHHNLAVISHHTLAELEQRLPKNTIVTLKAVLDEFLGRILLNIEIKGRGSGAVVGLFLKNYITKKSQWDTFFVSSFSAQQLGELRKSHENVNLALLQHVNPFAFVAHHRRLKLSAVGFHRLYVNPLALEIAKRLKLFTYAYTVNRIDAAQRLEQHGIDGIVSDYPNKYSMTTNLT
jgi:glycerophosphoryl diester phosphodiesterase